MEALVSDYLRRPLIQEYPFLQHISLRRWKCGQFFFYALLGLAYENVGERYWRGLRLLFPYRVLFLLKGGGAKIMLTINTCRFQGYTICITYKGTRKILLCRFFPLRKGDPPIPINVFGQNDYPSRGGGGYASIPLKSRYFRSIFCPFSYISASILCPFLSIFNLVC